MPDPFSTDFDFSFARDLGFGGGPPSPFRPYHDEEEQRLLNELLAKGTGALQWTGETIGKGQRSVAGTIGGLIDLAQGREPQWGGGLLNLLPGSDTVGLTDPKTAVTGRDILTKLGAPENVEGFHPIDNPRDALWDVAGFATDVATDPLTYVGIGPFTQSGKAALKAGTHATAGLAPAIRAGEKSLLSFAGIPIGTGETAAAFAGKVVDPAYQYLKYGNPVSRKLNQLFDPEVMGHGEAAWQKAAKEEFYPQMQRQLGTELTPLFDMHHEAFRKGLFDDPEFVNVMTRAAEGVESRAQHLPAGHPYQTAYEMGRAVQERFAPMLERAQALGIPIEHLVDGVIQYAARAHHSESWTGALKNVFDAFRPSNLFKNKARDEFRKDIEGGTDFINKLANGTVKINPAGDSIRGADFKEAAQWMAGQYRGLEPDVAAARATDFVRWVKNLDPLYEAKGKNFFNADPVKNAINYTQRNVKQATHAELVQKMLANGAERYAAGEAPEGYVKLIQAMQDAGLSFNRSEVLHWQEGGQQLKSFRPGAHTGAYRKQAELLEGLGQEIDHWLPTDKAPFVRPAPGAKPVRMPGMVAGLDEFYVPAEYAKEAIRHSRVWQAPEELSGIASAYNAILNFWKQSVTQVWPAFHARNMLGNAYYHWVSGAAFNMGVDPTLPFRSARGVLLGQEAAPEVLAKLNLRQTGELVAMARARGVLKEGGIAATESLPRDVEDVLMSRIEGISRKPKGTLEATGDAISGTFSDAREGYGNRAAALTSGGEPKGALRKAGIAADEALGAVMRLGQQTGTHIEDTMRLGHFMSQLAGGMTPDQAALSVKKWFFDYAELTPFERNVMKRVFPFYTWARKNMPLVLGELIHHPGGRLAQTIRLVNAPREQGYVPEWVGQGGPVIPAGKDGRFLTSLGLPFEGAFNWNIGPTATKTLQRNLESTVGSMVPPARLAYSYASGKDPFSGRELKDLYAYPTASPYLNVAIENTPASRAVHAYRRVTDPRKGPLVSGERAAITVADLFSGVKVQDITGGLDTQKELEGRKALNVLMDESPQIKSYTRYYADPAVPFELLPDSTKEYLRLQATMEKHAKEAARKKRQERRLTAQEGMLLTPGG